MSARRIYVDGKPVWQVIDDGAVGRTSHTRGAITGGAIVEPVTAKKRQRDRAVEAGRLERAREAYQEAMR